MQYNISFSIFDIYSLYYIIFITLYIFFLILLLPLFSMKSYSCFQYQKKYNFIRSIAHVTYSYMMQLRWERYILRIFNQSLHLINFL